MAIVFYDLEGLSDGGIIWQGDGGPCWKSAGRQFKPPGKIMRIVAFADELKQIGSV